MARVKQIRRSLDILRPDKARNAHAQPASGTARNKPAPSGRVWSPEDEVRILEGLAAFAVKHGKPPGRSGLRRALEGQPLDNAQCTVTQIYEKVRLLKTRYINMRAAGTAGDDASAARKKYELSAKIWGDEEVPRSANPKVERLAKPKVARIPDSERRALEEILYPNMSFTLDKIASENGDAMLGAALKSAFELVGDEEACEMEARAKEERIKAARVAIGESILTNEVLEALLKAFNCNV